MASVADSWQTRLSSIGVTYDVYLWRRHRATTVTPGAIFLSLVAGVECQGLVGFSKRRIVSGIRRRFGADEDEWPFELDVGQKHVFVGLGRSDDLDELLSWFVEVAARERLELYDPQETEPSEADKRLLERLKGEVGADPDPGNDHLICEDLDGQPADNRTTTSRIRPRARQGDAGTQRTPPRRGPASRRLASPDRRAPASRRPIANPCSVAGGPGAVTACGW